MLISLKVMKGLLLRHRVQWREEAWNTQWKKRGGEQMNPSALPLVPDLTAAGRETEETTTVGDRETDKETSKLSRGG